MHSLPSAIIVWIHSPTVWRVPIIHWYQSTRHKRLLHRPSFLLLPEFLRQVISLALIITSTFQHNESVSSSCTQCHDGSKVLLSTPCIISTSLSIRRTAFCSMHSTRRSNILLNCTSCIRCRHTIYWGKFCSTVDGWNEAHPGAPILWRLMNCNGGMS